MLIFAIDDEPLLLREAERAIASAVPDAELMSFGSAQDALDAMKTRGLMPDIVFSDIEMPGISGLEFAVALKTASPDARLVFVTGFSQYALDAFKVNAQGYILKPLTPELVLHELKKLPSVREEPADRLRVRCFGHFEVFWRDRPVFFARKQAKELLAFLIDQEGRSCTAEEICTALWENENNIGAEKTRLRRILSDLKSTLHEIGMDDVLIREHRQLAIRRESVDCDYYRMLSGDMEAVNSFRGEYMVDYSWAELTAGRLQFRKMEP